MSSRMLIVIFGFAVLFAIVALLGSPANAATCFKTREKPAGEDKVCFYDCSREQVSIIIRGVEICPLTYEAIK